VQVQVCWVPLLVFLHSSVPSSVHTIICET
jgi:hypothetical protein